MSAQLRVIQGGPLAPNDPDTDALLECICGDAWFELVDGHADGAIAMQRDGLVAAIKGVLRCASCGRVRELA